MAGDEILVTTRAGEFRYKVDEQQVVSPEAVEVLDHHRGQPPHAHHLQPPVQRRQRLIVVRQAGDGAGDAAPGRPRRTPATPARPPSWRRRRTWPACPATAPPAARPSRWGILCAAIWLATWWLSRLWNRRLVAYLVGTPIFLVALFVFFENFARLLPANI